MPPANASAYERPNTPWILWLLGQEGFEEVGLIVTPHSKADEAQLQHLKNIFPEAKVYFIYMDQ